VKKLLFALGVSLVACAPFEPGGSFNPISTRPNSGFSVKAGSSIYLNVFVGSAPNLGVSPAALYRQNRSEVSLSGSSRAWARVNAASLGGTTIPQGWNLSLNDDEVEVLAESSSFTGFDSIQTQTQVSLGTYRLGAQLGVPSSAAAGTYTVQARVDLRGASPVTLDWTVTVTK
jgi:hypothetical protein